MPTSFFAIALFGSCAVVLGQLRGVTVPKLPAVSSILNASSHTVSRISSHVSKINSHVSDLMAQEEKELAQQKDEYEEQLRQESLVNSRFEKLNGVLSTQIWDLEKQNDKLRQQAKQLQSGNANLRKALSAVSAKVTSADSFVAATLHATDDSKSADLTVLDEAKAQNAASEDDAAETQDGDVAVSSDEQSVAKDGNSTVEAQEDNGSDADEVSQQVPPPPDAKVQDDDSDDGKEQDDSNAALIALGTRRTRRRRGEDVDATADDDRDDNEKPDADDQADGDSDLQAPVALENTTDGPSREMLKELTHEIEELATQQGQSQAKLAKLFEERYKKGKDQQAKILAQQQILNSTHTSLRHTHSQLKTAVKHLEGTKAKLQKKVHILGAYLMQVGQYLQGPDAEKAIAAMPDDVSAFAPAKKHAEVGAAAAAAPARSPANATAIAKK